MKLVIITGLIHITVVTAAVAYTTQSNEWALPIIIAVAAAVPCTTIYAYKLLQWLLRAR